MRPMLRLHRWPSGPAARAAPTARAPGTDFLPETRMEMNRERRGGIIVSIQASPCHGVALKLSRMSAHIFRAASAGRAGCNGSPNKLNKPPSAPGAVIEK